MEVTGHLVGVSSHVGLGIELHWAGLVASTFIPWTTPLAPSSVFCISRRLKQPLNNRIEVSGLRLQSVVDCIIVRCEALGQSVATKCLVFSLFFPFLFYFLKAFLTTFYMDLGFHRGLAGGRQSGVIII